jgi:hypothetical protein
MWPTRDEASDHLSVPEPVIKSRSSIVPDELFVQSSNIGTGDDKWNQRAVSEVEEQDENIIYHHQTSVTYK